MRTRREIESEMEAFRYDDAESVVDNRMTLDEAKRIGELRHVHVQTELLLDLRDQNARIIELLSQSALSDISQSVKMRDIANNEIAAVMLGAKRNA